MSSILAGNLSAAFNIDGGHLQRYLERKSIVLSGLCDQILLHDVVHVPTQDYLTAAGLTQILGEKNLISLLEQQRLRFIRTRGVFCYVRGKGPDGRLVTLMDPNNHKSFCAPVEQSIDSCFEGLRESLRSYKTLKECLLRCSDEVPFQEAVDATHRSTYAELAQTPLWRDEFQHPNPDLICLPGLNPMNVRLIGPGTNANQNIVDTCLAIGLMNIELYLSIRFECQSVASGSPLGDSLKLKQRRARVSAIETDRLWTFLKVAGVPNFSEALLDDHDKIADLIATSQNRDAVAFRSWFHSNTNTSEQDLIRQYIDLLHELPWVQSLSGRIVRFAVCTGLGLIGLGGVDALTGFVDSFLVDKLIRKPGARFFIEDLREFSGRISVVN